LAHIATSISAQLDPTWLIIVSSMTWNATASNAVWIRRFATWCRYRITAVANAITAKIHCSPVGEWPACVPNSR
jgi:hypothetical protein